MSGIVGSSHNIRGSGLVAKLGTDGQVFTSAGAGVKQTFEDAAGGGKILQVVSTNKVDTFSEATDGGDVGSLVTGLTVAITCAATSSKVLVLMNTSISSSTLAGIVMELFRDTTQIDLGEANSSHNRSSKGMEQQSAGIGYVLSMQTHFLDSPSSTSEVVYGIKLGHTSGSSKTLYVNRAGTFTDAWTYPTSSSTITAIEVGA